MKTPDEIKKGLECCHQPVCPKDCPYNKPDGICEMADDLEAYVKQLEADNAELRRDRYAVCDTCDLRVLERRTCVPRWIRVEDRLPEKMKNVLVFKQWTDHAIYPVTMWHTEIDWRGEDGWNNNQDNGFFDVTHWMPLPEPPKE